MRYNASLPYVAVALCVFLAVTAAFICYGIYDAKTNDEVPITEISGFMQKNIFVSFLNSDNNTLDVNMLVSFDPKDATIKAISIPADTKINIASSDQMFCDVINIGGVEMMREVLPQIIPLTVDYHLIVKTADFPDAAGGYKGFLQSVFTDVLWQQENLSEYLSQILSLANTDLTLMKVEDYAAYIKRFAEHTTELHTLPGNSTVIGERYFYSPDVWAVNEFINSAILN